VAIPTSLWRLKRFFAHKLINCKCYECYEWTIRFHARKRNVGRSNPVGVSCEKLVCGPATNSVLHSLIRYQPACPGVPTPTSRISLITALWFNAPKFQVLHMEMNGPLDIKHRLAFTLRVGYSLRRTVLTIRTISLKTSRSVNIHNCPNNSAVRTWGRVGGGIQKSATCNFREIESKVYGQRRL
jgi:hypothetical protein